MATRKAKKAPTTKKAAPKKENGHGGHREGAGRPPILGTTMEKGLYVRMGEDQKKAIEGYVDTLNAKREKAGLPKITVSTWLRELALKHSGNEKLGEAARARARADSLGSIV